MNAPILAFRTRQPPEPPRPPPEPVDRLAYVPMPSAAQAAWGTMQSALSRVRPTFAGSFALAGKRSDAPAELRSIAAAAEAAASAIEQAQEMGA